MVAQGHLLEYDSSKLYIYSNTLNAIAVFTAIRVFVAHRIGRIFVGGLDWGQWNGFIHAVAGLTVVWLILWWMYRKKLFIKI